MGNGLVDFKDEQILEVLTELFQWCFRNIFRENNSRSKLILRKIFKIKQTNK